MSLFGRGEAGEAGAVKLLAVLVLVFAPISFAYNGLLAGARPPLKNDFTAYYVAGLAVRQGHAEALYYPEPVGSLLAQASQQRPWIDLARPAGIEEPNYYLYPPLFAVLFAPLTLLPYKIAFVAWMGLSAIFLAASLALMLAGAARDGAVARARDGWLAAAALVLVATLFYPVIRNLAVGQSSLLLLLLITGAMAALGRRTPRGDAAVGLCLAGGILLKLTPAILLPWLALRRRWRALAWCGGGLLALTALSVAAVGWEPHRVYVTTMLGKLSGGTAFYPNQSLAGLMARAAGGDMRLADLVDPAAPGVMAARLLALVLIAASLLVAWRRRKETGADEVAFGLLLLASLAASPISWEHHYVLALVPAWIVIRRAASGEGGVWWGAVAGTALAMIGSYVGLRVIGLGGAGPGEAAGLTAQALASLGLGGCLLLWCAIARGGGVAAARRPGERVEAGAALLVIMAVFAAGVFLSKVAEYNRSYEYGDFTSYYVAAATLLENQGDPLYYPGTPDMILARAVTPSAWTRTAQKWGVRDANYYLYPPFFAMAMTPLALVSYEAAHDLWYIANLCALGGCLLVLARAGRRAGQGPTRPEIAMMVVAVALSWPSLFTFGAGQANFVVLLLLLGMLWAVRAGRGIAAGSLAAGAVAVKLTPALLLVYFAWRRRWKALAASMAGLAALVLAGAAVTGWDSYRVYVNEMIPLLSRGCAHWVNESPGAFLTRLVDGAGIFSWAMASPSGLTRALTSATSLLVVGGAFLVMGPRPHAATHDLEMALVVVTTLFVSPISWTHHSVLCLMAFFLMARFLVAHGMVTPPASVAFALAFTLVNVYVKPPGFLDRAPLNALASYNLLGNLLLWAMLAALIRRARA